MSVFSRVALAGVVCAAIGAQAVAAPTSDDPGSTGGRFAHASKCVVTLGFGGGCDKDQADSKRVAAERKAAAEHPTEVTKAVDDHSTRHQFAHASECVVSFGFLGGCDKNAPEGGGKASATRSADAAPAPPDKSTGGQFKRASTCVVTFGFLGDCDRK
jgi:hypothetical protein